MRNQMVIWKGGITAKREGTRAALTRADHMPCFYRGENACRRIITRPIAIARTSAGCCTCKPA